MSNVPKSRMWRTADSIANLHDAGQTAYFEQRTYAPRIQASRENMIAACTALSEVNPSTMDNDHSFPANSEQPTRSLHSTVSTVAMVDSNCQRHYILNQFRP